MLAGLEALDPNAVPFRIPANGWRPRPYQMPVWRYLERGGKRAICFWHRRAGKDDVALNWTAVASRLRVGGYWHMLPEAAQARKAIWASVNPITGKRRVDEAFPMEIRKKTLENEMFIEFDNGSTWQVVGSDNYNSLVGSSPIGVVFSEWALADPRAWAYLRPILLENDGWSLFISTPRGKNHAWETLQSARKQSEWFHEVLPVGTTHVFRPETLERERLEFEQQYGREQGRAFFDQEYECSFEAAVLGSIYLEELRQMRDESRIGRVPHERGIPVQTAWDLGVTDATAIWFVQVVGREVRLIDYHEETGAGLDHYVNLLHKKRDDNGWVYGDHWFPHDLAAKEMTTGRSRLDTLRTLGVNANVVPVHHIQDGINATRRLLSMSWADGTRCERGLSALAGYRREWDDKLKTFKVNPLHGWESHGADALRCFAAGYYEPRIAHIRTRYKYEARTEERSWMTA